jgi:hypothetical protein
MNSWNHIGTAQRHLSTGDAEYVRLPAAIDYQAAQAEAAISIAISLARLADKLDPQV